MKSERLMTTYVISLFTLLQVHRTAAQGVPCTCIRARHLNAPSAPEVQRIREF